MTSRKIYLASSWRNPDQPELLRLLRLDGHQVYDFRNPEPGDTGFAWSDLDPDWLNWTPDQYVNHLEHPIAQAGYAKDKAAMEWADTFVLLLPSGRSAHLEAGWAIGRGLDTYIVLDEIGFEPELMYLLATHTTTDWGDLINHLNRQAVHP